MATLLNSWEEYREASDLPRYRVQERRWTNGETGDPKNVVVARIWRSQHARIVETDYVVDGSIVKKMVRGTTPSYTFILHRPREASTWTLTDITAEETDLSSNRYSPLVSLGLGGSVIELARDPGFQIVAQRESPEDGLFEIDFTLDKGAEPGDLRGPGSIASGTLGLDPKCHFVLRRGAIEARPKAFYHKLRFEYEYPAGDLPIPTRLRYDIAYPKRTEVFEERIDSTDWTPVPAERLKLTHYGIAEPAETRTAGSYRTPGWLYWFVGGVLCVLAGAFFVHRATRSRRAA